MSHIATAWAFDQSGISSTAKLVLIFLADYHNHTTNLCFPSRAALAGKCCCDEKTVTRAIQELSAAGLIAVQSRKEKSGRQTSNTYTLHISGGKFVHGEGDNLSPLEPVITNQEDSDTSYQTNSSLSFTDLLEDEEPPEDPKKIFWDEGIGSLMAMGLAEPTARSWLGKCVKMADGDLDRVAEVIQAAIDAGTMDPVRYMAGALSGKKAKKKKEVEDAFAELREASERRKAEWREQYGTEYGVLPDTGTGGGNDHVVLQREPVPEPEAVRKNGRKGARKLPAGRATQIVRPRVWDSGAVKVPPVDSGTGSGSAEIF